MEETPSVVVLEFKGQITFNTISQLLPRLKETLDLMGEKVNTYKRLLTITIETMENSFRYIENQKSLQSYQEANPPYFRILKTDDNFTIEVGNTILGKEKSLISAKIDTVNNLDETGLRELYKKTIANGQFSDVGGAGLGYIEMAKASGSKICYSFNEIATDIYYYIIKLDVKP